VSGNPGGRPVGARHKATVAAESLLDGQSQKLTSKAIELALAGDSIALRLCLERILPPRRERYLQLTMPSLQSAGDAPTAMGAIVQAIASGEITLGEAAEIGRFVELFVRAIEADDFEKRLRALEERDASD
jgi:hypothetical protein